jgi:hypothetical protein
LRWAGLSMPLQKLTLICTKLHSGFLLELLTCLTILLTSGMETND